MRPRVAAAVLWGAAVLSAGCREMPAGEPIRIDGDLSDWADVPEVWRGGPPPEGVVAPVSLRLANDPTALFLAVGLSETANLQGLEGALLVVLDADADPRTGVETSGLPGAELVIGFSRLAASIGGNPVLSQGMHAWRPTDPAAPPGRPGGPALSPYDIGIAFEPRHAARAFELRLPKTGAAGGAALEARAVRVRLVMLDPAGHPVAASRAVTYRFGPGRPRPPRRVEALERADGTDVRLAAWNISRRNLGARSDEIRRILAVLDPDIVLFDEVIPGEPAASIRAVLPGPPEGWSVRVGSSGSRQTGAVAARGPLEPAMALARVGLPDSVAAWLDEPSAADLTEVREDLERGTPTAGARVAGIGGGDSRLLVVSVDLVCCGNRAGSPEDRIRRVQAASIRAAVAAEIAGERAPAIVIAGDFNLVGTEAPLRLAGSGLDAGRDLVPAPALQLDGVSNATWSGGSGPFPPVRLDYVLYSSSRLEALRGFVFETGDLTGAELQARDLRRGDSDRASDHRPVVVDFAWRPAASAGTAPPP